MALPASGAQRGGSVARNPIIWLIGGIVTMVLSVNFGMVLVSTDAAPKLVTPDYYEQGVAYQGVIDARARATALGWQAKLDAARSTASRASAVSSARP